MITHQQPTGQQFTPQEVFSLWEQDSEAWLQELYERQETITDEDDRLVSIETEWPDWI